MAKKQRENYLDLVPVRNPQNDWELQDDLVTIHMVHTGFYAGIAQRFFHTPRVSHIDLDRYGTFVWQRIDGKATVGELALQVQQAFGQEAEPLYPRLVKYMQILRNNRFILFLGKDKIRS